MARCTNDNCGTFSGASEGNVWFKIDQVVVGELVLGSGQELECYDSGVSCAGGVSYEARDDCAQ